MIDALYQIIRLLINTLGGLYLTAVILRFLLQLSKADFYNPISQALVRVTNPAIKPLRRIVPGFFGIDVASLILAVIVKLAMILVLFFVQEGNTNFSVSLALPYSLLGVVITIFNIYFLTFIASIVFSWIAPGSYQPAIVLINQIVEPIFIPFRRLLPPMGGIDFSPILIFLAFNVVKIVLIALAKSLQLQPISVFGFLFLNI